MQRTQPTWDDVYSLRRPEAEALAAELKARGFLAMADVSGRCSRVDGEHIHLAGVMVRLTPAQARKLASS